MTPEPDHNLRLEIGHVLFLDLVGYSKLLIDEQRSRLHQLTEIVLATSQVAKSSDEQLVRLPTGDGMALVFRHSSEEPVRCALEVAGALKRHPEISVRMGVHSGPVSDVTDVSGRTNIAGAGINMAQRVMDCGDAGHILLSQRVAEDLAEYRQWAAHLHDLGECEVKHGVRLHLVNLYTNELGNSLLPSKLQSARASTGTKKASRSYLILGGAAATLFLIALAIFFLRKNIVPKAMNISDKSIAVLPFANSTGNPADEYFSDGMSEELISSLSRLSDLKVIGRTSSFQFKGKTADSKTIGEKLGVRYLLDGSVRKSEDRVRIAVALVKAADGANVWSDTYDRQMNDIFAAQSEIAGAVAERLQVALLGHDAQTERLPTSATPSNQDVNAYTALLQGNFYYERRTAEDIRKAIGYYEQAVRLDPGYALADAKLSLATGTLVSNYGGIANKEKQEVTVKARAAAERALQLDPSLAEAHLAKGRVLQDFDFAFASAESEFRRALQLAPQNPEVIRNLASLLSFLGRFDEAVSLTQRAIVLDPLRSAAEFTLANYLIALGRYDEAEAATRKAIVLQPQSAQNYTQLARIQILRGKPVVALALVKKETDPFWRTYGLALACFAQGDRAEADAALKQLIDQDAEDAGSQIASVYALRKEPDKMFEWLEHGWSTHDAGVMEILSDPFLRAYKDDPRFIAFARKIGLMPKPAAK